MSTSRLSTFFPALAVLGSVTSLAVGTSYAKQLFPLIGAQGTSALRVGFSALVLLMVFRPWRWTTSRADAGPIIRYGITLGVMNLLFYMALRTIRSASRWPSNSAGPWRWRCGLRGGRSILCGSVARWSGCCCCCPWAMLSHWIRSG